MKIRGKKLDGPNIEVVVIPRQSGDIVFKAQSVLDYEDHDKLNPSPKPPVRMLPGGITQENTENPEFQKKVGEWAYSKFHWMFLKSLEATEDLEWETVDMSDPTTWKNYKTELKQAKFAPIEIARIESCVSDACGLNQSKIDEATKRFLAGQAQAAAKPSIPSSAPMNTPSGEPVSASV